MVRPEEAPALMAPRPPRFGERPPRLESARAAAPSAGRGSPPRPRTRTEGLAPRTRARAIPSARELSQSRRELGLRFHVFATVDDGAVQLFHHAIPHRRSRLPRRSLRL